MALAIWSAVCWWMLEIVEVPSAPATAAFVLRSGHTTLSGLSVPLSGSLLPVLDSVQAGPSSPEHTGRCPSPLLCKQDPPNFSVSGPGVLAPASHIRVRKGRIQLMLEELHDMQTVERGAICPSHILCLIQTSAACSLVSG